MDQKELKVYRTLGNIVTGVKAAGGFTEAVQSGLREIIDGGLAEIGILWREENGKYRPFYWICPADISGIAGKWHQDGMISPEGLKAFSRAGITVADRFFSPVEIGEGTPWILEVIREEKPISGQRESNSFSEEDKDSFRIFCIVLGIFITEYRKKETLRERNVLYRVEDLHKSFRQGDVTNKVLKGVNLTVYEGEFLCFLGESGCGKSTLLNILDGLLPADTGHVFFEGKDILQWDAEALTEYRRRNIGFIFQSYNLMPNLNVFNNLKMVAELVQSPMDCMESLRMVGLADKAKSYPAKLSGGQQQRVSIARALVKKPRVIIADEPTAALDHATSIEILRIFERIRQSGTTILLVTHNAQIARMADRVVRISGGRVSEVTVQPEPVSAEELKW